MLVVATIIHVASKDLKSVEELCRVELIVKSRHWKISIPTRNLKEYTDELTKTYTSAKKLNRFCCRSWLILFVNKQKQRFFTLVENKSESTKNIKIDISRCWLCNKKRMHLYLITVEQNYWLKFNVLTSIDQQEHQVLTHWSIGFKLPFGFNVNASLIRNGRWIEYLKFQQNPLFILPADVVLINQTYILEFPNLEADKLFNFMCGVNVFHSLYTYLIKKLILFGCERARIQLLYAFLIFVFIIQQYILIKKTDERKL